MKPDAFGEESQALFDFCFAFTPFGLAVLKRSSPCLICIAALCKTAGSISVILGLTFTGGETRCFSVTRRWRMSSGPEPDSASNRIMSSNIAADLLGLGSRIALESKARNFDGLRSGCSDSSGISSIVTWCFRVAANIFFGEACFAVDVLEEGPRVRAPHALVDCVMAPFAEDLTLVADKPGPTFAAPAAPKPPLRVFNEPGILHSFSSPSSSSSSSSSCSCSCSSPAGSSAFQT